MLPNGKIIHFNNSLYYQSVNVSPLLGDVTLGYWVGSSKNVTINIPSCKCINLYLEYAVSSYSNPYDGYTSIIYPNTSNRENEYTLICKQTDTIGKITIQYQNSSLIINDIGGYNTPTTFEYIAYCNVA